MRKNPEQQVHKKNTYEVTYGKYGKPPIGKAYILADNAWEMAKIFWEQYPNFTFKDHKIVKRG